MRAAFDSGYLFAFIPVDYRTSWKKSKKFAIRDAADAVRTRTREDRHRVPAPPKGQPADRRASCSRCSCVWAAVSVLEQRAAEMEPGHDHARPAPLRPVLHQRHADRGRSLRARPHADQALARPPAPGPGLAVPDEAARDLHRPDRDSRGPRLLLRPRGCSRTRSTAGSRRPCGRSCSRRAPSRTARSGGSWRRPSAGAGPRGPRRRPPATAPAASRPSAGSGGSTRSRSTAAAARVAVSAAILSRRRSPAETLGGDGAERRAVQDRGAARRQPPLPRAPSARAIRVYAAGIRIPAVGGARPGLRSPPPGATTRSSRCRSPRSRRRTSRPSS